MKKIKLIGVLAMIISTATAQEKQTPAQSTLDVMKNLLKENYRYPKILNQPGGHDLLAMNNTEEPVFLFESGRGKVFASPPDNMRYLSPKFSSNMPVDKKAPDIYIPNALPKKLHQ